MKYDIFISHDVADKSKFTDQMVKELKRLGYRVWYSGYNLMPGQELQSQIINAMDNSRFGVVVFSPDYLESYWGMQELSYLKVKEKILNKRVIIPVWLNVTYEQVLQKMPLEACRYAINTKNGIDSAVKRIHKTISTNYNLERSSGIYKGFCYLLLLTGLYFLWFIFRRKSHSSKNIKIERRQEALKRKITKSVAIKNKVVLQNC